MSNPDITMGTALPRVRILSGEVPVLLAVLAGCAGLIVLFAGNSFAQNLLATTFLFAALSTSWNIIGGLGGQFSLGHSVFFAFGAYIAARMHLDLGLSPWLALVPAAAVSAGFAMLVSWPVFRLRGPFFAIATMAMTEVVLALAMYATPITGGAQGLSIPFRAGLENMIFRDRMSYAILMLGFLAVTLVVMAAITRSRLGYQLRALHDNEDTAEAAGIDVLRTKLIGMGISAALTACGGVLFLMYVRVVDPPSLFSLFDIGVKIALIALIGGIGTIYGPLLGALLVVPMEGMLRAELGGLVPGANLIVLGAILVLTAMYLRKGIAGTGTDLWARLRGGR